MVWGRKTRPSLLPQNRNREVHVVYNVEKTSIPPGHGRFVRVCTGGEGIGNQISTVTAELPEDRICRLPVEVRTAEYPFTNSETQIFVENRTEQEICIPKQSADRDILERGSVQQIRGKDKPPSSVEEKRKFVIDSFS